MKMSGDSILQKIFSLQESSLHELAKICWGDFLIRKTIDGVFIIIPSKMKKLVTHRETVVKNIPKVLNSLPKTFFNDLPKKLWNNLINAIISLQQGYIEAIIWEEKCESLLPFTILNPMTAGDYQAGCFIDPVGRFNDLAWAKRFVSDKNQIAICRFELACLYCFKEKIADLWHMMKIDMMLPCNGKIARIRSVYGNLVGLWAYHLENKFDELVEEDTNYEDGFYACGLREAIFKGYENAARFFWAHCSDRERANFLRNPGFELISVAAKYNHAGLVNFIYSLLPQEQKNNLISWSVQNNRGTVWIWSCLLHSLYYETALKDILTYPFPIPSIIYERLLTLLTYKMKESRIPIHEKVFEALWNHLTLTQRREVFELNSDIMINLANIKALTLLKMIIQPLSRSEKDRMLLDDWQDAGESALEEFSKVGDYNAFLSYLLFFFIDRNPLTQKLCLRGDATDFLDRFIKAEFFVSEPEEKDVNKVIESLQASLQVLYQLLEKVEDMDSTAKSTRIVTYRYKRKNIDNESSNIAKKRFKRLVEDNWAEIKS